MAIKLLINGIAGSGKTDLLRTLGEDTFVVSRDAKEFGLEIPHMLVDTYYDMTTLIYGADVEGEDRIEGIMDKVEKYKEHYGDYPKTVVIDSVSQLTMDVIDKSVLTPDSWGSQGKEVTKELSMLVTFIHEDLELNGINVILLNHVTEEKSEGTGTGNYVPFGQGQFKNKGAFYATTNESILVTTSGNNRKIHLRGEGKQARTFMNNLPDTMWVENTVDPTKSKKLKEGEVYFNLKDHLELLASSQKDVKKWSF